MAPMSISGLGPVANALLFIALGFVFGFILESAGFGKSNKLAGQFYFTDSTVLQVMFGSIVVAAILIAWSGALGLIDFERVFVNPTFLGSGVLGGLIMGVGFTIGGYCPGTSLVSMATLKKDGALFVLGAAFGIFLFGETVGQFQHFFAESGNLGRFSLPELFGWDAGVVVFLITVLAIGMFWGSEKLRIIFHGENESDRDAVLKKRTRIAAAVLVGVAFPLLFVQQPSLEKKWGLMTDKQQQLEKREVQIHPAELHKTLKDDTLRVVMYDLSDESDWNRFHLLDAKPLRPEQVKATIPQIKKLPAGTITMLMSHDEVRATEAYKLMVAAGVVNVYILEGGVKNWMAIYANPSQHAAHDAVAQAGEEHQEHSAKAHSEAMMALGDRAPGAAVEPHSHGDEPAFTAKIKLQKKVKLSGGCG